MLLEYLLCLMHQHIALYDILGAEMSSLRSPVNQVSMETQPRYYMTPFLSGRFRLPCPWVTELDLLLAVTDVLSAGLGLR